MTYLDAINSVLRRLREDEVASPNTSAYSKLIGEFVNDSISVVENAWNWSQLRRTERFNTVEGQRYYPFLDLNFNYTTLQVVDSTGKQLLDLNTQDNFTYDIFTSEDSPKTGAPEYYANTGLDNTKERPEIAIYPFPDGVYKIRMTVVDRSDRLTEGTDNIKAPFLPITQLAHAMAAEERGELGGTSTSKLYAIAQSSLSDAVAMDAGRFPTETVWYDV